MGILDLLFPKTCVGCGRGGQFLCASCQASILQGDLFCPQCKRVSIGGLTHTLCRTKYGLDGLWTLGLYKPPLKQAIQKLKYRWVKELAKDLIDITTVYWAKYSPALLDEIKKNQGKTWIITYVPLHWKRENSRGFNQSELLAKLWTEKLGLSCLNTLTRVKETKQQARLTAVDRRENLKNAFSLNTKQSLLNVSVILVDDVWTTGATLKECTKVLKRAGAKTVWGLTIAR